MSAERDRESCKGGDRLMPEIDLARCEGKADCERVCPYGVFDIRVLPLEQRAGLSFPARMKSFFHGWKKAVAARADECHACGACVEACPEKAIKLVRRG